MTEQSSADTATSAGATSGPWSAALPGRSSIRGVRGTMWSELPRAFRKSPRRSSTTAGPQVLCWPKGASRRSPPPNSVVHRASRPRDRRRAWNESLHRPPQTQRWPKRSRLGGLRRPLPALQTTPRHRPHASPSQPRRLRGDRLPAIPAHRGRVGRTTESRGNPTEGPGLCSWQEPVADTSPLPEGHRSRNAWHRSPRPPLVPVARPDGAWASVPARDAAPPESVIPPGPPHPCERRSHERSSTSWTFAKLGAVYYLLETWGSDDSGSASTARWLSAGTPHTRHFEHRRDACKHGPRCSPRSRRGGRVGSDTG